MRLRVTTEDDTFVYATSPISFGGISKEDLIFWMVPTIVTKELIYDDGVVAFAVGLFCLWLYKKATAGKPAGDLVLSLSVKIPKWYRSEVAGRIPPLKQFLAALDKIVKATWFSVGLMPAPQHCNRYEP